MRNHVIKISKVTVKYFRDHPYSIRRMQATFGNARNVESDTVFLDFFSLSTTYVTHKLCVNDKWPFWEIFLLNLERKRKETLMGRWQRSQKNHWNFLDLMQRLPVGGISVAVGLFKPPYKEAQSKLRWRQGSKNVLDICFVSWMHL